MGEVASKTICNTIGIEDLIVEEEILLSLEDFGIEMAKSYSNFMRTNILLVKKLIEIINPIQKNPTYNINKYKILHSIV